MAAVGRGGREPNGRLGGRSAGFDGEAVGRWVGRLFGSRADAERVEQEKGGRRWRKAAGDKRVGVVVVVVGGIVIVGGGGAARIGGVVLRNVGGIGVVGGRMGWPIGLASAAVACIVFPKILQTLKFGLR